MKINKIISGIAETTTKTISSKAEAIPAQDLSRAEEAINAPAELMQSYNGIKPKKLFANFSEFKAETKTKLEEFKEVLPKTLYENISAELEKNNFSIQKIVSNYYQGLNNCNTFEEVKRLYPELSLPNLKIKKEIAYNLRKILPKKLTDEISKIPDEKERINAINRYFDNVISKQVEGWEIYPEFKQVRQIVAEGAAAGKFEGKLETPPPEGYKYWNNRMPLRYRFLHVPNREKAYIEMLKKHFAEGKNLTEIFTKTTDGKEIYAYRLSRREEFPELDIKFRRFIQSAELNAKQFSELSKLSKREISSAVMTQTWRTSRLRIDLGNETAYRKDWSLIKPVWQKTMFPETTFYPTDKLIDAYLIDMFKNGKVYGTNSNPLAKYKESPYMDKNKIMLLKKLYKYSKDLDSEKRIIESPKYQEFKAQFNLEEMKNTIEDIEKHYKNAFFKRFWTDERKARFTTALNQNKETANQNIKLSDELLTNAMDNVFSEV